MADLVLCSGGSFKIATLGSDSQDSKASRVLTYNVSSYPNYQSFTADNFMVNVTSLAINGNSGISTQYIGGITKNYNPSTGIITITKPAINHPSGWYLSSFSITTKLVYCG